MLPFSVFAQDDIVNYLQIKRYPCVLPPTNTRICKQFSLPLINEKDESREHPDCFEGSFTYITWEVISSICKYCIMVTNEGSCCMRQFFGGTFLFGDQDLVNVARTIQNSFL